MTQDDWIMLTNKANVVEKDMIKLLDWFIKVRKGDKNIEGQIP